MRTLEESRKYEVLMPDGSWQLVHWEQLDIDDVVRCNPKLDTDVYHVPDPFVVCEQPALCSGSKIVEHPHLIVDSLTERKALEDAKEKLLSALPYFRKAVADARAADGRGAVKLAIVHKYADGSGKVGMTFDCDDFFDDLALVLGAGPQTSDDDAKADAAQFVQKFGIK